MICDYFEKVYFVSGGRFIFIHFYNSFSWNKSSMFHYIFADWCTLKSISIYDFEHLKLKKIKTISLFKLLAFIKYVRFVALKYASGSIIKSDVYFLEIKDKIFKIQRSFILSLQQFVHYHFMSHHLSFWQINEEFQNLTYCWGKK